MTEDRDASPHDVVVHTAASVRLFEPRTDEARTWLAARTGAQRWQWTAHGLAINPHMAVELAAELRQAGFTVTDVEGGAPQG